MILPRGLARRVEREERNTIVYHCTYCERPIRFRFSHREQIGDAKVYTCRCTACGAEYRRVRDQVRCICAGNERLAKAVRGK